MNDNIKKCMKCGSESTCRWHKGPICHKCYADYNRGRLREETKRFKENNPYYIKNWRDTNKERIDRYREEWEINGPIKDRNYPTVSLDKKVKSHNSIDPDGKVCSKCKIYKQYCEFHRHKGFIDGRASTCRECKDNSCSSWYSRNSEQSKKKSTEYYQNNKDKRRIYNKKKEEQDPCFKMRRILRHRLRQALKNNHKGGSAVRDLGCTIEELKARFETMFYPNPKTGEMMTWENHGPKGWHIDHIKPATKFDLSDPAQQKELCNYKNLQPLWYFENIAKSDNYEDNL